MQTLGSVTSEGFTLLYNQVMKKVVYIIIGLFAAIVMLVALAGVYKFNYLAAQPGFDVDGNRIEEGEYKFEIIEVLDQSCQSHVDCATPMEYAVRSSCPYDSFCIESTCTVICPTPFSGTPVPRN